MTARPSKQSYVLDPALEDSLTLDEFEVTIDILKAISLDNSSE